MKRPTAIQIALFVLTFLSTLAAGAIQKGINPLDEPFRVIEGLPFSATLMLILLSHELSHYISSRMHRTDATLPYFIPAPSIIGTFGAFIKMKSPIESRKALIDIGASGPIAGFVISVFASVGGLWFSAVVKSPESGGVLALGDSILFSTLSTLIVGVPAEGYDIMLHPVAFAGWIGLFVTTLNLLPIGQLDGGHISYAVFGGRHRLLSIALVSSLIVMGVYFWTGWLVWAVLMIVLGIKHPPVMYWESPLDPKRRAIGWLCIVIFILTFVPTPFEIIN